jgi:SNF2 family DNA or RNA helicase
MGLGKSAIAIHNAGMLYEEGKVTGVLVLSPKGVHRQWVAEQIPEHLDPNIKVNAICWSGLKSKAALQAFQPENLRCNGNLTFLSLNIDAIRTADGFLTAVKFLRLHEGRSMMIVDESHLIKNGSTERTKRAMKLGLLATYRRISTGTPIAKNIVDAFSQFAFLDPRILGQKYVTAFRARYCVMGGWEGKQIVGQKNTEEFYSLIAPHAFRLTKAEALDLPPKIYVKREYEPGDTTRAHYENLRKTYMTSFESGEIVDVANAAVAMLRLQQVLCGYLPITDEDGRHTHNEEISSERIEAMMEIVDQTEGQTVIWSRFIEDGERIVAALSKAFGPGAVAHYTGGDRTKEDAKERFMNGTSRFFVANPAAGGTGLNLQGKCQVVIYYSNSFDALHRWQSEDRTHRMGMAGAVTYFDLVATKSVDKHILKNLSIKKSISDLTLDEIRQAVSA